MGAVHAGTADLEFVLGWFEVILPGNCGDKEFEFLGVDIDKLAAVCAVEMVMMWPEGARELIALLPAEWYYLGDAECREELERPIDADSVG